MLIQLFYLKAWIRDSSVGNTNRAIPDPCLVYRLNHEHKIAGSLVADINCGQPPYLTGVGHSP